MNREILDTIREKGLLIEKEIYDLIGNLDDAKVARHFLETLERISGQKIITKSVLSQNIEYVQKVFAHSPEGNRVAEKTFWTYSIFWDNTDLVIIFCPEILSRVSKKCRATLASSKLPIRSYISFSISNPFSLMVSKISRFICCQK